MLESPYPLRHLLMRRVVLARQFSGARALSHAHTSFTGEKRLPWATGRSGKPPYPDPRSPHPLPRPRLRKTHIEWMLHHGNGPRLGMYGPSRELADFEFDDGTPASVSPRRYAFKHHQDHLLVQLIRAGAAVEESEAAQQLPRVPGTKEQRDWDPEIPLFLEDLDEKGSAPRVAHTQSKEGDQTHALLEERFDSSKTTTPINVGKHSASREDSLEVNTMFATYDPTAFVNDEVPLLDRRRPFWSRRRWNLSDNFMVPVSPKPKNTIKDE